MHALIIEDQPIIGLLIEEHLRDAGYRSFDHAITQDEAIAAAGVLRPDLITSDVRLAEGCGMAAVRAICADRPIPVLFITATPWVAAEGAGDAVILAKPFGPADLGRALSLAGAQLEPGPPSSVSSL